MNLTMTKHRNIAPRPVLNQESLLGIPLSEVNQLHRKATRQKRASTACINCKISKRKCSGESPCASCTAFGQQCLIDKTLDKRRRVTVKRMAGELNFCHNLLDDLLKIMRAEDQSLGLKLLDFVRLDTTSIQIREYLDDVLRSNRKNGEQKRGM
ncbi:hypothetical protein ASPCAL14809 [Aspergillus calidoustus]|uniref:Zn(2)-C6 fungal-type domain-containing protein n=1 Tax=Aspergillus calidoustus TaxID=454130 RepID=A0A0U5GLI5_ASPCI|nr:hypothetical protein ASPCAL14809 [Aspergillus calidoustus]